jgi:prolyl oligopeptidase
MTVAASIAPGWQTGVRVEPCGDRPVAWPSLCRSARRRPPSGPARRRPTTAASPTGAGTPEPRDLIPVPPPPPARVDDVVEERHGLRIADPYRWLEDGTSSETRAWTAAHNERTRTALDAIPARGRFRARLAELTAAGTAAGPTVRGERLFTVDRWGDRDRAVLALRSLIDPAAPGPGRVLLDPADVTGDATSAIDWFEPSPDGRLVAFGTSVGGDERSTLRVLDVDAGTLLPDAVPHTRAASVAWLPDASGFAYTRYPDPEDVGPEEAGYHRTVWWHRLGTPVADDEPCFTDLPTKEAWPSVSLSHDGRWLLVHLELGWTRTDVHLLDRSTGAWATVLEGVEALSWFEVDEGRGRLLGRTTLDAPRGRIVAAPLEDPGPARWLELVPEGDDVCEAFAVVGDDVLVARRRVGVSTLVHHRATGAALEVVDPDVALGPSVLSVTALASHPTAPGLVAVGSTTFDAPDLVLAWRVDEPAGTDRRLAWFDVPGVRLAVAADSYPSTDGTDVPLFRITGAAPADPSTPTVLFGYGGFGITETPAWSPFVVAWCEAGGQVAIAGIRGGGEHGEAWHEAGMRDRKPQVFADFEAAADWLVAQGLTARERLAIRGGSNGGLLVAACQVRRPDLCAAVVCEVPLTDMVRFPEFLIARLWIPEYGDPAVAEDLAWLHAYSPYHQVADGTCYPATLVTTGEEDSRVDPCHARKHAARLLAATSCGDEQPILLRVETAAGHGQGKPASKQIEERADVLAFLTWRLTPSPA